MRTRLHQRTAFAIVSAAAATLVATATMASAATGAQVSAARAARMPDAAVAGCDVLLTRARRPRLPAAVAERRVHRRARHTPTGRRLNISSKVDPANVKGVHVNTAAQNQADGFSPGARHHDVRPGPEHRHVADRDRRRTSALSLARERADRAPRHRDQRRACPYFAELDAQTTDPAEATPPDPPRGRADRRPPLRGRAAHLVGTNGARHRAARDDEGRARRNAEARGHAARTSAGSSATTSATCSARPCRTRPGTSRSRARRASPGPALTMRTLAYKWLDTHHVVRPAARRDDDRLRARVHRDVGRPTATACATCTAPSRCRCSSATPPPLSGSRHRCRRQPEDQRHADVDGELHLRAAVDALRAAGPATPTLYGHGLLGDAGEVEGGSFSAGIAHDLMGCATDWVGMSGSDIGERRPEPAGHVDVRHPGRPHAPGIRELPVPRPPDQLVVGLRHRTPRSSPAASRASRPTTPTSWDTARAASWAARCRRSRPNGTARILGVPGMDYGGCSSTVRSTGTSSPPSSTSRTPTRSTNRSCCNSRSCSGTAARTRATPSTSPSHPYPGIPAKQIFIIENYGDHQVANVAAEMLARTIGAQNHQPAFNPSFFGAPPRLNVPVTPQWGLAKLDQTKPAPAGLVLWDYGTPTPPTTNLAPNGARSAHDPHGFGRGNALLLTQITTFLSDRRDPERMRRHGLPEQDAVAPKPGWDCGARPLVGATSFRV